MLGPCQTQVSRLMSGKSVPIAKEALERVAQLYGIEQEIRERSPAERKDPASPIATDAGGDARLVKGNAGEAVAEVRRCRGDPLRTRALECIAEVLRGRARGDGQQSCCRGEPQAGGETASEAANDVTDK